MTQYISFDGTYPVRVITKSQTCLDGGKVVTDDDINAEDTDDLTADYDSIEFESEKEAVEWLEFYAKKEPKDSNELFNWRRARNIAEFLGFDVFDEIED